MDTVTAEAVVPKEEPAIVRAVEDPETVSGVTEVTVGVAVWA